MTLTEFLLARIAEDEVTAREVADALVRDPEADDAREWYANQAGSNGDPIVAVGPTRALAECAAKRRIVEAYKDAERTLEEYAQLGDAGLIDPGSRKFHDGLHAAGFLSGARNAAMLSALAYADHPDFDPSWRV